LGVAHTIFFVGPHGAGFQRTGFHRTGYQLIFIDGHPSMIIIDGYPSMIFVDGYPSMIFIDDIHQ